MDEVSKEKAFAFATLACDFCCLNEKEWLYTLERPLRWSKSMVHESFIARELSACGGCSDEIENGLWNSLVGRCFLGFQGRALIPEGTDEAGLKVGLLRRHEAFRTVMTGEPTKLRWVSLNKLWKNLEGIH